MKKFIIILIAVFSVIVIAIFVLTHFKIFEIKDSAPMLVGLLTCCSTSLLGGVAYYQTKSANKISSLLSRSQLVSFIKFDASLDYNGCEFAIEKNWEDNYDGAILEKNKIEFNTVNKYIKFSFKFKVEGAPLILFYLKSFSIGTDFKQFNYTIKNQGGKIGCGYSPNKNEYLLNLYVEFTKDFEQDISKFVRLDLNYISQSIYNIPENVKLSFYGIPKPTYDKSVNNYIIENMTIHDRKTHVL